MNELQAGIEFALTVFPQSSILLQPGKAALDDPALGDNLERVQFTTPGNLHCHVLAQDVLDALGKRLTDIAAITQQTLDLLQVRFAALESLQRSFAIGHFCRGYRNSMRQTLGIYRDMTLDA